MVLPALSKEGGYLLLVISYVSVAALLILYKRLPPLDSDVCGVEKIGGVISNIQDKFWRACPGHAAYDPIVLLAFRQYEIAVIGFAFQQAHLTRSTAAALARAGDADSRIA